MANDPDHPTHRELPLPPRGQLFAVSFSYPRLPFKAAYWVSSVSGSFALFDKGEVPWQRRKDPVDRMLRDPLQELAGVILGTDVSSQKMWKVELRRY
jgi:hypothetical protein